MICPRCGKELPDTETICPYCLQKINENVEFNNYKEDGFVHLLSKEDADEGESSNYTPKYFSINQMNIFVVAVVFILIVSAATVFGVKFLQRSTEISATTVTEYKAGSATSQATEPPTENTVKNVSIKNIYGSWKFAYANEEKNSAIDYYSFSRDGIVQENFGSIVVDGKYRDFSDENDNMIYIDIDSTLSGVYHFNVTGNKKDGYFLSLTNTSNSATYLMKKTTAKSYSLDQIKNYKIDNDLIGKWISEDENKSYAFNDDGTLSRVTNSTTTNGVWTKDKKGSLTVKYMRESIKTIYLNYKIVDNQLIINDVVYSKQ